jgi:hypothetical protein
MEHKARAEKRAEVENDNMDKANGASEERSLAGVHIHIYPEVAGYIVIRV